MAEVFYFHVQEDRSIKYKLIEPIMQEDKDVATWRFRIPKVLNEIDMSGWAWWFVHTNANGQQFSELLTLIDDIDEPDSYSTADYDIDYGISKFPGSFSFALEAINAQQGGEISGEWHTRTYSHKVDKTLQGNQAEYAETESDVISALMQEVRNKVNQLVGGATPLPVNLKSQMTDHDKVYLYTGSEDGESTGYWYHWNGTQFVPGGQYGAGVTDAVPTQGSTNAVSSGGVYESINEISGDINDLKSGLNDTVSRLGYAKLSFTVSEGGPHSAKKDLIELPYKTNAVYVTVEADTSATLGVSGFIGDSTTQSCGTTLTAGKKKILPLVSGVDHFGIYVSAVEADTVVSVTIEYADSVFIKSERREYKGNELGLELGGINISTSGWSYTPSIARVRTPYGETVHLYPNDVVSLSDYTNSRMYIGYKKADGTYGIGGVWLRQDFIVADEGDYVFVISNLTDTAQTSSDALSSLFKISHSIKGDIVSLTDISVLKRNYGNDIFGDLSAELYDGYISTTGVVQPSGSTTNEKYTNLIPVTPDSVIRINGEYGETVSGWVVYATYDKDGKFLARHTLVNSDVKNIAVSIYGFASTTAFITISLRTYSGMNLEIYQENGISITRYILENKKVIENDLKEAVIYNLQRENIRVVCHRGYTLTAPENTIPAFKFAKEKGFDYVETDIRFTSDDVPVCIHDSTVDRTSDGEGYVSGFTYDEIRELDFGSWFSSDYAGTKVPSFEEFLLFCKLVGLHPYIEIKGDTYWSSNNHVGIIANIVKKLGMSSCVTFIAGTSSYLDDLITFLPNARYGLLMNALSTEALTWCINHKNAGNEVFADVSSSLATSYTDEVNTLVSNDIPLEIWTVSTPSGFVDYVTGYTTNGSRIWKLLFQRGMEMM